MTDDVDTPDVAEEVEASPAPEQPAPISESEQEARLWGWKAPHEWEGEKPAGYIADPERYVDRLKGSRLFKTFEQRMEETVNRIDTVYQRAIDRERKDWATKMAELQAQQRKAVETADVQEYERIEAQKRALQPPAPVQPNVPQINQAAVQDYIARNDWAKDPTLRTEGALAIDAAMKTGVRFRDETEQLQYAESVMRRKYPHMFQAAQPPRQRVDAGGLAGGAVGAGKFDKLPNEAKAAFRKMVAQGLFTDDAKGRAQYLEDYDA